MSKHGLTGPSDSDSAAARASARGQQPSPFSRRRWLGGAALAAAAVAAGWALSRGASKPKLPAARRTTLALRGASVINPDWHRFASLPSGVWLLLGGDGCLLRSQDEGRSWQRVESTVDETLSAALALDAGACVAVGGGGTALHSDDAGRTWTRVVIDERAHLRALAVDAMQLLAVGDGGAAWRSDRHGRNWTRSELGTSSNLAHAVAFPNGHGFVLAGSGGALLRGTPAAGFSEQIVDDGASITCLQARADGLVIAGSEAGTLHVARGPHGPWEAAVVGSARDFPTAIVATADGDVVVATSQGRVLLSRDSCRSWQPQPVPQPEYVAALGYDKERKLYWSVGSAGAVHVGDNAGRHWQRIEFSSETSIEALAITSAGAAWAAGRGGLRSELGADRRRARVAQPAIQQYLHGVALHRSSGALVAVGRAELAWRSEDGGQSWETVALPLPSATTLFGVTTDPAGNALLAYGTGGVLLRSEDGGKSWRPLAASSNTIAALLMVEAAAVALALDEGPLVSRDGGRSFVRAKLPRPVNLTALAHDAERGMFVAVGRAGDVAVSGDNGRTFELGRVSPEIELRAALIVPGTNRILVCGAGGKLFASTDGARTFQAIATSTEQTLNALGWHDSTQSVFAFGNGGTLLRSADSGVTFQQLPLARQAHLRALVQAPSGELLVVGAEGAVLQVKLDGSIQVCNAHTRAGLAGAVWTRDERHVVLVGGRIVRLESERG